jgi:hypothetical protein
LPRDDFYTPTDIDALRMENELLAFEVRYLKTQLAEAKRLESRLSESEHSAARSKRAEQDLVLLLRRLGSSPLGWLFRLRPAFRTLEKRYLGNNV